MEIFRKLVKIRNGFFVIFTSILLLSSFTVIINQQGNNLKDVDTVISFIQKGEKNKEIEKMISSTYGTSGFSIYGDTLDWGVDDIDAERVFGGYEDATDLGGEYTGSGIKIAILDS